MSDQEKIIRDYEQNIFDSQVDLSFHPIKTEKLRDAFAGDSLRYYDSLIVIEADKEVRAAKLNIQLTQMEINMKKIDLKYEAAPELREIYRQGIKIAEQIISIDQDILDKVQAGAYYNISDTINSLMERASSFAKEDSIVGSVWECTYQIKNPMLSNAKQTITNKYLFSLDNQHLIRAIE